jgi:hypothetical protein
LAGLNVKSTGHLVDFCTCRADRFALFLFLCLFYLTVLKQLSFNFKMINFFLQSLSFEMLLPVFVFWAEFQLAA